MSQTTFSIRMDSELCIMQTLSQVGCLGLCSNSPLMPRKLALLI